MLCKGTTTSTFLYDASQQRIKQMTGTTGKSETTLYVSKAFEVIHSDKGINNRITQYKHYIYAGNEVVAIQVRTRKNGKKLPDQARYLHKDALGNVDTITDTHGKVIQRINYKPFGKRDVVYDASRSGGAEPWTSRGFTGHEHLEDLGLIHMNARLYDPEIGRFISPDTYIPQPGMAQSYNRYAYVMNNPLKYTDPSGHFPWLLAAFVTLTAAAMLTDIPLLDGLAMIAMFAWMGPASGIMNAVLKGAAAGFVQGAISRGNPFASALWGAGAGATAKFFIWSNRFVYPLKYNHWGKLQPYNPATGRYMKNHNIYTNGEMLVHKSAPRLNGAVDFVSSAIPSPSASNYFGLGGVAFGALASPQEWFR